jgi:hypothetical protein
VVSVAVWDCEALSGSVERHPPPKDRIAAEGGEAAAGRPDYLAQDSHFLHCPHGARLENDLPELNRGVCVPHLNLLVA